MRWVAVIVAGVASALYWWLVLNVAYGLVGGDRAPGLPPVPEWQSAATLAAVAVVAIALHAGAGSLWWRMVRSRLG